MTDKTTETHNSDNIVVKTSMAVWKKFLLYPAVIGTIFGAVPTTMNIHKMLKYDVDFTQVNHSEQQRAFWVKNLLCTSSLSYQKLKTENGIEVEVGACKNGDVLLTVRQDDSEHKVFEWISLQKDKQESSSSAGIFSLLMGEAFADTMDATAERRAVERRGNNRADSADTNTDIGNVDSKVKTMCQKLKGGTKIIRVVNEGGVCFKEKLDIMKGIVSGRKEVSCDTKCK